MKQVELALRDVSIAPRKLAARRLIRRVFREGRGITLVVPMGPEYQEPAQGLFDGAFGYYRNYAAHESGLLDERTCARVLVIASELLDLLGASERTLSSAGGVEGLVEAGIFKSAEEFRSCLRFYEIGHWIPEEAFDGYWEDLAAADISSEQEKLLWELALIQCRSMDPAASEYEMLEVVELTEAGQLMLRELGNRG